MYASQQLQRLGLDHSADERAIKRAYARELKQIDQETDAHGFQALRHAYEVALEWVARRPVRTHVVAPVEVAEPEMPAPVESEPQATPLPASLPAGGTGVDDDPLQLATTVFDRFIAVCGVLNGKGDGGDLQLWHAHLQRSLRDDRLLNLAARARFEYMIARRLTDGWQPGHEKLFGVACAIFGWDGDRRRLAEFGRIGSLLDQAIDEDEMFKQQDGVDCAGQSEALRRVRDDARPGQDELRTHAPHLKKLVARFPAWTSLMANTKRIMEWISLAGSNKVSFGPASNVVITPKLPKPEGVDDTMDEDPDVLARAVYEAFLALYRSVNEQGTYGDSLVWRKHLKNCAGDDRLLNLAARVQFEYCIALLLAEGWRPGHEALFIAARQVFGWDKDRRRLTQFGQAGHWVNQAIEECEMFNHQGSDDCTGQIDAIARVRDEKAPSTGELIDHVPHLRVLRTRFPAWTSIIASSERTAQWLSMEQALPAWRRLLRFGSSKSSTASSGKFGWGKLVLGIFVVRVLFAIMGSAIDQNARPLDVQKNSYEEQLYQHAAKDLYMPIGTRSQTNTVPVPPKPDTGRALNDAEMKAIARRVNFLQWPDVADGTYKVDVEVELDDKGQIAKLKIRNGSGLPSLDTELERAVRASAPFGPEIRRRFGLNYWWRRGPKKSETAKDAKPLAEPKPIVN